MKNRMLDDSEKCVKVKEGRFTMECASCMKMLTCAGLPENASDGDCVAYEERVRVSKE